MCMADFESGDTKAISQKLLTARKQHKCGECYRVIEPHEIYEEYVGFGDSMFRRKTCQHCVLSRTWLEVNCGGRYIFGAVLEDLQEHWYESPEYRSLDLGRKILGMKKKWQGKSGNRLPLPNITMLSVENKGGTRHGNTSI